jgi:hypothetical protein
MPAPAAAKPMLQCYNSSSAKKEEQRKHPQEEEERSISSNVSTSQWQTAGSTAAALKEQLLLLTVNPHRSLQCRWKASTEEANRSSVNSRKCTSEQRRRKQ